MTTFDDQVTMLREARRQYVDLVRAVTRLDLQMQSIARRAYDGDKDEGRKALKAAIAEESGALFLATRPFVGAIEILAKERAIQERRIVKLTSGLPGESFVEAVRGFGRASFGAIVGEAGRLDGYPNHRHLWKRFGLAVIEGLGRQRRVAGEEAKLHGFNPERRALMFVVGDCLLRAQTAPGAPFRGIYDQRKAYEIARDAEIRPIVAHMRAKRFMEKALLRDLWRAWRADLGVTEEREAA